MSNEHYQDKVIEDIEKDLKTKVGWQAFTAILGILLLIFGWLIAQQLKLSEVINDKIEEIGEVKGDVKVIRSDVGWLKEVIAGQIRTEKLKVSEKQ